MSRYSIMRQGNNIVCRELLSHQCGGALPVIEISKYVPKPLHIVIIWNRLIDPPSYNSPVGTEIQIGFVGNGHAYLKRHISSGALASFSYFHGNKYFDAHINTTKEAAYSFDRTPGANGRNARTSLNELCQSLSVLHGELPNEMK